MRGQMDHDADRCPIDRVELAALDASRLRFPDLGRLPTPGHQHGGEQDGSSAWHDERSVQQARRGSTVRRPEIVSVSAMASMIARAGASRYNALWAVMLVSFACGDLQPINGSSDAGVQVAVADAPVAERIFSPNPRDTLGRTCTTDADCPLLSCVKSTDTSMGGGGPAHGYCSTACKTADDSVCTAADGKCIDFARVGAPAEIWCVQTCRRGGDAPDMNKCRGRTDVACTPSSVSNGEPSVDGYCLPTCNSDVECAARRCDPSSGVCVDTVTGDPTGTACSTPGTDGDTGAASSACAGVCLTVGASAHVCAQRCTYGIPDACRLPAAPIDAGVSAFSACIFVSKSTGPGDEAHCGQLCDVDADCLDQSDPGVSCNKSDAALKAFGHGYCDWLPPVVDAGAETQ